mmetsp:Transcript_7849/g.24087  ORF Transcript_7849/g.24087 Transcript_7849/m.24087 type:complete len:115 (+) Transcript_7849:563-907(+)
MSVTARARAATRPLLSAPARRRHAGVPARRGQRARLVACLVAQRALRRVKLRAALALAWSDTTAAAARMQAPAPPPGGGQGAAAAAAAAAAAVDVGEAALLYGTMGATADLLAA